MNLVDNCALCGKELLLYYPGRPLWDQDLLGDSDRLEMLCKCTGRGGKVEKVTRSTETP